MASLTAHIINHTHWDREWFLTAEYTSQWIPGLIDSLGRLAADNPDFRFFLDGQTLVIEDLLRTAPEYAERAQTLIRQGHLVIGPYYCQPDWQITGGELLVRNLMLGLRDVERLGGKPAPGWLVDTFGHTTQTPQIHRLFGIEAVYVWRGVPRLEPYFVWVSPDGSRLFTINLFGGYRNLYGVSHAPEVAAARLHTEVNRLQPFYPTPDIPLFDGYDLEDNPEDPIRFYEMLGRPLAVSLTESTPERFADTVRSKGLNLPTLHGELNSGKYGATFPGTFSTRTYLKLMASDCERLLFSVCEPLAVMARLRGRPYPAERYEAWARLLLQNAVHDCICGVSIDQVHEKMEYSYRQTFDGMLEDMQESLGAVMGGFAAGEYAVSTNPIPAETWLIVENRVIHTKTDGVGVWPVVESSPLKPSSTSIQDFVRWTPSGWPISFQDWGGPTLDKGVLGALIVSAEHGDTYSDERGERLGMLQATTPPVIESQNDQCTVIYYEAAWADDRRRADAKVRIIFDPSLLVRWEIELDSRGTDFRVEMIFQPHFLGRIRAGAPFDVVERAPADTDLLPGQLPDDLASVLLGQRELNTVESFPFHDFVAIEEEAWTMAVLAKGLHSYRIGYENAIILNLRRSVEWLTKANLRDRIGDAGPFFYVPDARCERSETHEIAFAFGPAGWIDTPAFHGMVAAYRNPPILVRAEGPGAVREWEFLREDIPASALYLDGDTVLARLYNPTSRPMGLNTNYEQAELRGRRTGYIEEIAPKQILTVSLYELLPPVGEHSGKLNALNPPRWRVGENHSSPDPAILAQMEQQITSLEAQVAEIEAQLHAAPDGERLQLQHRYYILKRESVEAQLSLALNRRKLARQGPPTYEDLHTVDAEIARIGFELNQLRIKRRIFDYVVQVQREE